MRGCRPLDATPQPPVSKKYKGANEPNAPPCIPALLASQTENKPTSPNREWANLTKPRISQPHLIENGPTSPNRISPPH
eukprot:scaffold29608_cov101-Isochrysis_galbana.AAC.1